MKLCWLLTLLICGNIHGQEFWEIESGEAEYQGRTLYLRQGVTVEHSLGKMASKEMVLRPLEGQQDIKRMGTLTLDKAIRIELKEGGQLTCAHADIDFPSHSGVFTGSEEQEFVVYVENCRSKGQRLPLVVKSHRMDLLMTDKEKAMQVHAIDAIGAVTLDYNHDFIAVADKAHYVRGDQTPSGETRLPGILTLEAHAGGLCRVANRAGDLIHATTIVVDTEARTLNFQKPKGSFNASRKESSEKVDFTANTLLWEDRKNTFSLDGDVFVNQKGIGALTTDGTLNVVQKGEQGKRELDHMQSNGKTVITQPSEAGERKLTCVGEVLVDNAASKIFLKSAEENQVLFEDKLGKIFADQGTIIYAQGNNGLAVDSILLEGNVRLKASDERYALADRVEIIPAQQQIYLKGKAGQRVLFFDEEKDVRVSAPEVILKRDLMTKKETIKGLGDVRFSFIEQELSALKNQFKELK